MRDHEAMWISIPSQYAISRGVGLTKDQSAIPGLNVYAERKRNCVGSPSWVSRYFRYDRWPLDPVIQETIRNQEQDKRWDPKSVALTATGMTPRKSGSGSRPRIAALSGSQTKAPALPGDTYFGARLRRGGADKRSEDPKVCP